MSRLLHVAIAQFRPTKGQYAANLARLGELFSAIDALDPRPQLLVLPESALTGYFLEGGTREAALTAGRLARDLDATYRAAVPGARTLEVVVGFYEIWREALHNSALVVRLGARDGGEILHVHRKNFLPTYGLFDEERFVERGTEVRAFDMSFGRAAVLVCEDAWHSLTGTVAALDGAQVVCVVSAAPGRGTQPRTDGIPGPASNARWERLVRDIAEEHGVFVLHANLIGSEGGKLFTGGSMVVGPKGDVRARAPLWDDAVITLSLDLGDLVRARADAPMIADLRTQLPHLLRSIEQATAGTPTSLAYDDDSQSAPTPRASGATSGGMSTSKGFAILPTLPHDHGTPGTLDLDVTLTEAWLIEFLRSEMARRRFTTAVVGLSGGVDSAVTTYLAAKALGPEHVLAVRMPYKASSRDSLDHAQLVIDALGVRHTTVDISAAVDGYLSLEPEADATRRGNVMARTRMLVLFDHAAKHQAIPLGTGNKSERLFGYFTWHADDSPPINPLGDLFKTQVWQLARHLGIPAEIVGKPASADLVSGQTDEGDFGISYAKADVLLHWMLHGYSDADLTARGFAADEVRLVRRRLESTHWKRRLPTVAMLSGTAIGESYLRPVDY